MLDRYVETIPNGIPHYMRICRKAAFVEAVASSCVCQLKEDHDGYHRCSCGVVWEAMDEIPRRNVPTTNSKESSGWLKKEFERAKARSSVVPTWAKPAIIRGFLADTKRNHQR